MIFENHFKRLDMKKLIFTIVLLISVVFATTAQDTTMVEQYCKMIVTGRVLSTKVNIDLDFGEERKLFGGDTRLKDDLTGKLKKFHSTVDALNYMGAQGWALVNAFPIKEVDSFIYHYYFRKLFKKSQLN